MKIAKGEIWKINSRSFSGEAEILEDVENTEKDDFVKIRITTGRTHYLNREDSTIGEEISIRTTLTKFISKIDHPVGNKLKGDEK